MTDIATIIEVNRQSHHVLIYEDGRSFIALGIETDLQGHGSTPDCAVAELTGCIEAKTAFAKGQDNMGLLDCLADQHFLDERYQVATFLKS